MSYLKRLAKPAVAIMASVCIMTGCATKNPNDPFENYNRVMFNVNEAFDHTAFKPLAMLYDTVMPDFAQTIVTNSGSICSSCSSATSTTSGMHSTICCRVRVKKG
mgnify:CR=1 FL=1